MEPRDESPPASPPAPPRRRLRMPSAGPLVAKLGLIVALIAALNVAVSLVAGLVNERESRHRTVRLEIGSLWGGEQTIAGPILAVPYGTPGDRPGPQHALEQGVLYLLPEALEIGAEVLPQMRHRGIFEAVVYSTEVSAQGHFRLPSVDDLLVSTDVDEPLMLLWERAFVAVGISDMRSIRRVVELQLNGQRHAFVPGTRMAQLLSTGMSVDVPVDVLPGDAADANPPLRFDFSVRLNGSRSLSFLPLGRETNVRVASSWPAPSFFGAYLPETRDIDHEGFSASWVLSHFGRDFGQVFASATMPADMGAQLAGSAFGVKLYQPVTTYRKVQRAIKYGLLFLVFTFGFYFLVEVMARRRIHAVQYALVGVPLCLFYLLLVAFAEHIGFGIAYASGAACVIALVSLYSMKILASARRAAAIATLLAGLYAYLYMLLQQENYSLLGGALGLLALTAAFMYATRDINWYGRSADDAVPA